MIIHEFKVDNLPISFKRSCSSASVQISLLSSISKFLMWEFSTKILFFVNWTGFYTRSRRDLSHRKAAFRTNGQVNHSSNSNQWYQVLANKFVKDMSYIDAAVKIVWQVDLMSPSNRFYKNKKIPSLIYHQLYIHSIWTSLII